MPVGTEEGLELHTPEYERRIATTVYASMFTAIKSRPTVQERGMWAAEAVAAADALMAELDRRYLEERGS